MERSGELQAAFVSEVSAYLRFRALDLREASAEACLNSATQAIHEQEGVATYRSARESNEAAQISYRLTRARASEQTNERCSPNLQLGKPLRGRSERSEHELDVLRRDAQACARLARRRAAESYWRNIARCRLPEDFFADVRTNSILARLPQRFPIWWGRFVQALQDVLQRTNPSYCRIMERLPHLRAEAQRPGQRFVLSALVDDWRKENAERFGLLEEVHVPMLERRSFQKHAAVSSWFKTRAGTFKSDRDLRERARRRLYEQVGGLTPDVLYDGRN